MVDISINESPKLKDFERYVGKLEDGIDKTVLKNFLNTFKNDFCEKQKEEELKSYCETILDCSKDYPFFFAKMGTWPVEDSMNKKGFKLTIIVSDEVYKG